MPQKIHVLFLCHDQIRSDQQRQLLYLRSGCWIPCCGSAYRWWTGSWRPDPHWSPPQKVSVCPDPSRTAPQSQRLIRSTAPACREQNKLMCPGAVDDANETMDDLMTSPSYLSVESKASLSRWRCSRWSFGASRDQEQERSWVALGPWWGEGDSTRPTVAFFTVPPQRAAETRYKEISRQQTRVCEELFVLGCLLHVKLFVPSP